MCNFIYIHFENIFLFLCFFSSFHCTFKHVIISKPLWTRGEVFGFVSSTLLVAKVSIKIAFHVCLLISRGIWPITTQVSFFGSKAFSALAKRSWWFENSLLKEISCPTNGLEFSVWFSNFLRLSCKCSLTPTHQSTFEPQKPLSNEWMLQRNNLKNLMFFEYAMNGHLRNKVRLRKKCIVKSYICWLSFAIIS